MAEKMDGYPTEASRWAIFSGALLEPSRADGHSLTYSLVDARSRRKPHAQGTAVEDEDEDEVAARSMMREAFLQAVMDDDEDEELQELIEGGAIVDEPDWLGRTALILAAAAGMTGVMSILLEAGADPDATDQHGRSALLWASGGGWVEAVDLLLGRGVDASRADDQGDTALMLASLHGHTDVVSRLLPSAACDMVNARGEAAIGMAALLGHSEVCSPFSCCLLLRLLLLPIILAPLALPPPSPLALLPPSAPSPLSSTPRPYYPNASAPRHHPPPSTLPSTLHFLRWCVCWRSMARHGAYGRRWRRVTSSKLRSCSAAGST